jgi:hypothetical protein
MKFRIVERKRCDGEVYFLIQRRILGFWCHFPITEVSDSPIGGNVVKRIFAFSNADNAISTLNRVRHTKYTHNGIPIYPTIKQDVFYTPWGAKEHKNKYLSLQLSGYWYKSLIHGSYESCCKQIDNRIEEMQNLKHKRIIKL